MDDLFDEIRNDIAEEYNIRNENLTENELRSDLKHKIEKYCCRIKFTNAVGNVVLG